MTPRMHQGLTELAWRRRSTASEIIRLHVAAIQKDPLDEKAMDAEDAPDLKHTVSVAIEDDLYLGAKDAAYPTRNSFTSLLRRRLMFELKREGIWETSE
jgi:hypothetical protein